MSPGVQRNVYTCAEVYTIAIRIAGGGFDLIGCKPDSTIARAQNIAVKKVSNMFRNDRRNGHIVLQTGLEHPGVCRKASRTWVEVRIVSNINPIIVTIQTERLTNLARRECRSALQRAVVAILNVVSITISRPPAHHVWWRWNTRPALACAAGIDNCLDFRLGKRATEDFYFVDLSFPEVPIGWTGHRDRSNPVLTICSGKGARGGIGNRTDRSSVKVQCGSVSGNVTHASNVMPVTVQNGGGRYGNNSDAIAVSEIEINPAVNQQRQNNFLRAADVSQGHYHSLCSQNGRIRF